jgi:hypothetical protein
MNRIVLALSLVLLLTSCRPSQSRQDATLSPTLTVVLSAMSPQVPTVSRLIVVPTAIITRAPTLSPTPTHTKVPRVITGEFTLEKALELLYGDEGIVQTDNGEVTIRTKRVSRSGEVTAIIRAVLAAPFRENDVDKYVVLVEMGAEGMSGHAQSAEIGGAIFYRVNNTWQIDLEQRYITSMGSFGHAPLGELVKIGPDRYGFIFHERYASTGIGGETVTIIAAIGKDFKIVFSVQTALADVIDNKWGYSSKIDFVPGKNPANYDIKVTTTGTKIAEGKVTPFEAIQLYEFTDAQYEPRHQ